ncbi:MAG: phospholipid/glycerol acyltransferase [uncultured bacterium]|nr:MAG: phospholipid/glycerol acyltransferase [uncultured bacterium]HBH19244.1 hypothetical protein [Cyanobacteria bacterium UBA9579]
MKSTEAIKNSDFSKSQNSMPAIPTRLNPFWLAMFDYGFSSMLKKAFYSIQVKNAENYNLRNPNYGNILFASHCCWWDGQIGYLLCRKMFKTKMHMMIEQLYRFPLLSRVGAFSIEKDSPQSAIKALNYSAEVLKNPDNGIWIFPQGKVMPPDYRPIELANGIAYICKKLDGVNLIPIAHRYNFIREDRPEAFIEVGKPIILENKNFDRKDLTHFLEKELTDLLDKQREDICHGIYDGYEVFLKSELCMVKRIEQHLRKMLQIFMV